MQNERVVANKIMCEKKTRNTLFGFIKVTKDKILKEIKKNDIKKAFLHKDVSCKLIKQFEESFAPIVPYHFNNYCHTIVNFPDSLKTAEVIPTWKKDKLAD